jgi:hypothetical protein
MGFAEILDGLCKDEMYGIGAVHDRMSTSLLYK